MEFVLYSTNPQADVVLNCFVSKWRECFNAPDDLSVEPVDRDPNRWSLSSSDVTDLWRLFQQLTRSESDLRDELGTFEFSVNNF